MIGLFDSGYGGLTVLSALHQRLPHQQFLYYGDNANAPYGPRSSEDILRLTTVGVENLFALGARLVILACNSATATAMRPLQQNWLPQHHPKKRVLGIIAPMIEEIAQLPWYFKAGPDEARRPPQTVAIFATRATVASGFYPHEIALRAPNTKVVQQACPELAGLIEADAPEDEIRPAVERHVAAMLAAFDGVPPQKAVLGCTHFPLIEPLFRAALPPETQILSQPARVAAALVAYLFRHPDMKDFARHPLEPRCLTTGDPERVTGLATRFYGRHLRFEAVDSALAGMARLDSGGEEAARHA
jgi:glutamate racemase